MSTSAQLGRTYNQTHVARPYTPGKRRFSIYLAWSYPGEANRDVTELDNRFSTMTEVRQVGWPFFEAPQYADPVQLPAGNCRHTRAVLSGLREVPAGRRRGYRASGGVVPAHRPGGQQTPARRARTRRHGYAAGVGFGPYGHRAGSRSGGNRGGAAVSQA